MESTVYSSKGQEQLPFSDQRVCKLRKSGRVCFSDVQLDLSLCLIDQIGVRSHVHLTLHGMLTNPAACSSQLDGMSIYPPAFPVVPTVYYYVLLTAGKSLARRGRPRGLVTYVYGTCTGNHNHTGVHLKGFHSLTKPMLSLRFGAELRNKEQSSSRVGAGRCTQLRARGSSSQEKRNVLQCEWGQLTCQQVRYSFGHITVSM